MRYLCNFTGNDGILNLNVHAVNIVSLARMYIIGYLYLMLAILLTGINPCMKITQIEHGILDEQATTFGQDSVVDNRCLAHPAEEAVEGTVAFWVGHKIDAQWQFDERDPTRIGLLADITGQHRSIYLYRIRSNTDLVKKEIPLGKVLLAATRTHEYQETEQDSRYPCADISFLPSNDI
jgi:hypothetical protein